MELKQFLSSFPITIFALYDCSSHLYIAKANKTNKQTWIRYSTLPGSI